MQCPLFWGVTLLTFNIALAQLPGPPPHDQTTQCKARVNRAYQAQQDGASPLSPALEFVDSSGSVIAGLTPNNASGVTYKECKRTCQNITGTFDFGTFAASVSSWMFPWLALAAQLPYETSGFVNDGLNFLLAVGSPALTTYSLAISLNNRVRVTGRINDVIRKADRDDHVVRLLNEQGRQILLETQQEPVRAWEGTNAALSSLILLEENEKWWSRSQEDLKNTQRGVTISLIAQMLFAVTTWLFTVIASFDRLGDPTVALSISASSIWLWMVPVVTGWVGVGTQSRKGAVNDALSNKVRCVRERSRISEDGTPINPIKSRQTGIIPTSDLLQAPQPGTPACQYPSFLKVKTFLGMSFAGQESKEGPIYNFARVFTYYRFTEIIIQGFESALKKIANGRAPEWHAITSSQISEFCGYNEDRPLRAYPQWPEIPARVWRDQAAASVAAIFVQWGTTGPSILQAYKTPVMGLGCRSGSYLIYGCVATLSWIMLVAASMISHELMLRQQATLDPSVSVNAPTQPNATTESPATATATDPENNATTEPPVPATDPKSDTVLAVLSVLLSFLGKCFAGMNALWLIASTLMELSGVYDSCWCQAVYVTKGEKGWILLFQSLEELAIVADSVWVGEVVFVSSVCVVSCGLIWLTRKDSRPGK